MMLDWLNTRRGETADGQQKKQGINRRGNSGDPRIDSATTGSNSTPTAANQAVVPQALLYLPAEIFTVGGEKLTYTKLIEKYDVNVLKVLMAAESTTVEAHNYSTDGDDCGRMSAAEERAFIARMHKTRVEAATSTGGYAIPEVRIADRNDAAALSDVSTADLAEALRARGIAVTLPEQPAPQPAPAPVDPRVQALMNNGMSREQAEQVIQTLDNPQPAAPQPAPAPAPQPGPAGPGRGH